MKGKVYVYTGDGKGKTTSALGMALKAYGDGQKVFFGQFIKGDVYSEIHALKRLSDLITVEQFGLGRFPNGNPSQDDIEAARNGLEKIKSVISSDEYGMVILDEATVAIKNGLISEEEILKLIAEKPTELDLIITGRNASPLIIEKADEVLEMKEVKHYYQKGVPARVGIEK